MATGDGLREPVIDLEGGDTKLLDATSFYARWLKPAIDRVAALVLLILLSPIMVAVAVAVLVTLGRPLLYRQERVGRDGRPFTMLKFRSMQHDRRGADEPDFDAGWDGTDRRLTHKTPEDPRHTRLGRFIRKFSLDELPQFINVLRGDLSLIGPRPELKSVVDERYRDWQHARHAVRPGLTGLWQVTLRDDTGQMHRHVHVDLRYIRTLSPLVDLKIALLTIPTVLGIRVNDRWHEPRVLAPDPTTDNPAAPSAPVEVHESIEAA